MSSTVAARVAISEDFLTAFAKLPKAQQSKVTDFISKFRAAPTAPGINYEKLSGLKDQKICSVRIDLAYRAIVVREKETGTYLLLWVDHHDEAYSWAMSKRCEVNPKTGAIQVFEVKTEEPGSSAEVDNVAPAVPGIFAHVSDSDLLELHVPEAQISFVRSFKTTEEFENSRSSFAEDAFEALSWVLEDIPIDEIREMLESEHGGSANGSGNISDALNQPETLKSFVVVEGEEELRKIMSAPLEKWRVFLHPTQRKLVQKKYNGPARVLGGAGTGKTVVAMHRAKYLASLLPDTERILFTTFTANLAADIQMNLQKICTMKELRRIVVINLDSWVGQYLKETGYTAVIKYGNDIDELWDQALIIGGNEAGFSRQFYEEEWNRVAIAQSAVTKEAYCKALRNGRGTRLDRKKRLAVWKVFDAYQTLMKERGVRDINTAMYECTKLIEGTSIKPDFRHIIVDEGQDLSNNAYQLLRAMAGPEHENDIFIVGDSHQRIYKNKPVLSKCGINVKGRSSILHINYRTTEEIRKAAIGLLNGISFDNLDDEVETSDQCQSLTHGSKPVVKNFTNANGEVEYVLQEINALTDKGISLNDICVVARTNKLVDQYLLDFKDAGIKTYQVKRSNTDDRNHDGLRIATMHRVKGLEFQYVFIVAANDKVMPLNSAIDHTDSVTERESITAEKCLLYVAMTRAQKCVYLTSYGKPSKWVQ